MVIERAHSPESRDEPNFDACCSIVPVLNYAIGDIVIKRRKRFGLIILKSIAIMRNPAVFRTEVNRLHESEALSDGYVRVVRTYAAA